MELRVLRYFLAVVREGSITAAAQSLHMTQPTLSKQLMELEDELGKQLFVRGKHRVRLTEAGEFMYRRAQEIVDLADRTRTALRSQDGTIAGDVSIGCGETEGMRISRRMTCADSLCSARARTLNATNCPAGSATIFKA